MKKGKRLIGVIAALLSALSAFHIAVTRAIADEEKMIDGVLTIKPTIVLFDADGEKIKRGTLSEFRDEIARLEIEWSSSVKLEGTNFSKGVYDISAWDGSSDEIKTHVSIPDGYEFDKEIYVVDHPWYEPADKAVLKNGQECKFFYVTDNIDVLETKTFSMESNGVNAFCDSMVICLMPRPNGTNIKNTARLYFDRQSAERGSVDNLNLEFTVPSFELTEDMKNQADRNYAFGNPVYGISLNNVPCSEFVKGHDYNQYWDDDKPEDEKSVDQKLAEEFIGKWKVYIDGRKLTDDQYDKAFYRNCWMSNQIFDDDEIVFGPYVNLLWLNKNGYAGKTMKIVMPCTALKDSDVTCYIHSSIEFDLLYYSDQVGIKKLIPTDEADSMKRTQRFVSTAFVKTYDPVEVDLPTVVKKTAGDTPYEMPVFKMDLINAEHVPEEGDSESGEAAMPERSSVSLNGEGSGSFGKVKFIRPGTYTYEISENTADKASDWSYDDVHYLLRYKVVSDDKGKLSIENSSVTDKKTGKPVESLVFTNTYTKPAPASISCDPIVVEKQLAGDPPVKTESFLFELLDGDRVVQTAEVSGSGTTAFDSLNFDETGVYAYSVREVKKSADNWTYDESVYDIVYTIEEEKGVLHAERSVKKNGSPEDKIVFVNRYTRPVPASIFADAIVVEKKVIGDEPDVSGNFSFVLQHEGETVQTVSLKGAGKVSFDALRFEAPGTYGYTVNEVKGSTAGWIYDEDVYSIVYTVSEKDGKLESVPVITLNEKPADAVVFTNTYKVPGVAAYASARDELEVQKVITGDAPRHADAFEFELSTDNAENPLPQKHTVTIRGQGTDKFGPLVFEKPGTYDYKVKEVRKDQPGYTYDASVYTVTYDVYDMSEDSTGLLGYVRFIESSGEISEDGKLVFTNTYNVAREEAKTGLGVPKELVTGMIMMFGGGAVMFLFAFFSRRKG